MRLVALSFILFCFTAQAEYKHATVVSLKDLKRLVPGVDVQVIHKPIQLKFERFPLASSKSSTWESPVIPETFILKVPQGRVFSDAGLVLVDNKYVTSELLWPWSEYKKGAVPIDLTKLGPVKKVAGKVVVLTQEGHRNYYHWMVEILPKLALLQKVKSHDWIYLPKMNASFQKQTLELMGVDLKKVIEAEASTIIEADEVIALSFVSRSCYTPPWVSDFLRESLLKKLKPEEKQFSPRIFISRAKASYRRITNEDELFRFLEPIGFKRYYLEELSVDEQMKLFSQAQVIISPHGAGLTNILFSKPGTKVLEIFQSHEDDSYCYLSQTLKLEYHALKTTAFKKGGGYVDTTVSLDLFKKFVNASL